MKRVLEYTTEMPKRKSMDSEIVVQDCCYANTVQ